MSLLTAAEVKRLRDFDQKLVRELEHSSPSTKQRLRWRCGEVQKAAGLVSAGAAGLATFQKIARQRGLFDIRLDRQKWRDSDGEKRWFTLARAASTTMFPMGTHYWVRDNAIIGAILAREPSKLRRSQGRDLLLSGLTFMSSVAQLKRFDSIVRSNSRSFREKVENWPRIFAAISDNLNTTRLESWAHKQDAWQILVWHVLDGLECGVIKLADLTAKHRRFLGLIVPFLAKVSFWKAPNSGSWEELEAVRTSVRAWEHRLIVRLADFAKDPRFSFIRSGYAKNRRYLSLRFRKLDLFEAIRILDRQVSQVMIKDLPFECPMYSPKDVRYRSGDATLIYLLQLDYVAFLADRSGRDQRWIQGMEERLLSEVLALTDDRSGGIVRYRGDSYQRSGFFRALTVAKLVKFYGAPSGDASKQFAARSDIIPRGRQAAWTHFVWQLAAWSGGRFITTGEVRYLRLHDRFFMQGLRLITGSESSLDVDQQGVSRVVTLPKWRMPECYIADKTTRGKEIVFPSPHTPLNWAVAEMLNAFRVRSKVLAQR